MQTSYETSAEVIRQHFSLILGGILGGILATLLAKGNMRLFHIPGAGDSSCTAAS